MKSGFQGVRKPWKSTLIAFRDPDRLNCRARISE